MLLWLLAPHALAATIAVPADQATLSAAVAAANDGDVITLAAGTYAESIDINGKFGTLGLTIKALPGQDVTIDAPNTGAGNQSITLTAGAILQLEDVAVGRGAHRAIYADDSTLVLLGVDISNCSGGAYHGRAVFAEGNSSVSIIASNFNDNDANTSRNGGHIYMREGGTLDISGSTFSAGRAQNGGALYLDGVTTTISSSTFDGNRTVGGGSGGAIHIRGTSSSLLIENNSSFLNGDSDAQGGAIYALQTPTVTLRATTFTALESDREGGAVYFKDGNTLTVSDAVFDNVRTTDGSTQGGAFWVEDANATFLRADFIDVSANNGGGAIFGNAVGDLSVESSSFHTVTATCNGGAIRWSSGNDKRLDVVDTPFESVSAGCDGGAIWHSSNGDNSAMRLARVDFTSISSSEEGGAVYASNTADIDLDTVTFTDIDSDWHGGAIRLIGPHDTDIVDTTFTGVTIDEGNYHGGAIAMDQGPLDLVRVDFHTITGANQGGAVWADTIEDLRVEDCSFTDVSSSQFGGALRWSADSSGHTATLLDSTFTNVSSASNSGGALHLSGTAHTAVIQDSTFHTVSADDHGGAVYIYDADDTTIDNVDFTDTTARLDGGAVKLDQQSGNVKVADVTFTNSTSTLDNYSGGALWGVGAAYDFDRVTVLTASSIERGGAIYLNGVDDTTFDDCSFTDVSTRDEDGGIVHWAGNSGHKLHIGDSTFVNGVSGDHGGHVYAVGTNHVLEILDTSFTGGMADNQGGAVYSYDADTIDITRVTFDGMYANSHGGALLASTTADTGTLTDVSFNNHRTDVNDRNGGAIFVNDGTWSFDRVQFSNVDAYGHGGAVYMETIDGATFTDVVVSNAVAEEGGALWFSPEGSQDPLTITGGRFSDTSTDDPSTGQGGAIYTTGAARVTMTDTSFTRSAALRDGGVYYAYTPYRLELVRNTFCDGTVSDASRYGGHVYVQATGSGDMLATNNVFVDGSSGSNGGAMWLNNVDGDVHNNHFISNYSGGQGSAVWIGGSSNIDFRNNVSAFNNGVSTYRTVNSTVTTDYNAWWSNTASTPGDDSGPGTNSVSADPAFLLWSDDLDCSNDNLGPDPLLSSLVDAADPDPLFDDPNGSRGDIGAYGGLEADLDDDLDGYRRSQDCDDNDDERFPGNPEICDDKDNDCNELVDDNASDATTWYADDDGDLFGDALSTTSSCNQPAGFVANALDCRDDDAAVKPGALEVCNDKDDDCNGVVDGPNSDDAVDWFDDDDGDSYGNPDTTVHDCSAPSGYVDNGDDCNDADAARNPDTIWHADTDADGYGDPSNTTGPQCAVVPGHVIDDRDCNDADPDVNPDTLWYRDADGDGYGNPALQLAQCTQPVGYVNNENDCDDTDDTVPSGILWFPDVDGDGFGDGSAPAAACDVPTGYVDNDTDCDDAAGGIYPGADDSVCDGVDTDCDGAGGPLGDEDGDGISWADEDAVGADGCSLDSDLDGVPDAIEWGALGRDTDGDGLPDIVDDDDDDDGVPTLLEDHDESGDWTDDDLDFDGVADYRDPDDDGDEVLTIDEDHDGDGDPSNDDTDGDGLPDYLDLDDDNDGVETPYENVWGTDPLNADTDDDGLDDGYEWGGDPSVDTPQDFDGDGYFDVFDPDDDNDGVPTSVEGRSDNDGILGPPLCDPIPLDWDPSNCDPVGDGLPAHHDLDADGDGTPDELELDGDTDEDGVPDILDCNSCDGCTGDVDGDGIANCDEDIFTLTDPSNPDTDGDGVWDGNEVDLTDLQNTIDTDGDGTPDALDTDDDGDGELTINEDRNGNNDPTDDDTDGDGTPDYIDTDDDGDGVPSADEIGRDTDEDGIDDNFDTDDDGDGIPSIDEDTNGNGDPRDDDLDCDAIPNFLDLDDTDGGCADADGDGVLNADEDLAGTDRHNPDSDGDGLTDGTELDGDPSRDTDGDGLTDAADSDDDGDGVPTIEEGLLDTDGDGILDHLDSDSDDDGVDDGDEPVDADCDGRLDRLDAVDDGLCGTPDTGEPIGTYVPDTDEEDLACGCRSAGRGAAWLLPLLLVTIRRRQRQR